MHNSTIATWKQTSFLRFISGFLHAFVPETIPGNIDPAEENRLVTRAVKDPQAFDELYRRYINRVYAFHLVRTGSRDEAEDLTSLTFLAALEGISAYRQQGSFAAWLFGIARRKLADHYRQPVSLAIESITIDPSASPEDSVDHRIRLQQVSQAMTQIEADRVEALNLRVFAGLSTAEIARLLTRSEGAVRNLVYRAIQDIRTRLVPEIEKEEM